MKSNSILMQEARLALRGRWDSVVGYHFLSIIISGFCGGLFLIMAPIELGLFAIYLKSSRRLSKPNEEEVKFVDFFSGFTKGYLKSVGLVVLTWFIIFIMMIVLSAIVASFSALTGWFSYEFNWFDRMAWAQNAWTQEGVLWVSFTLFFIPMMLAWAAYIIVGIALSQTPFIWVDNPQLGVRDTIKRSVVLMRKRKWQYFCLSWRFLGWGILSVLFTFGIGFLWLIPYMRVTQARFYDEIVLESSKLQSGVKDVKVVKETKTKSTPAEFAHQPKIPDIYKNP